MDKKKKQNKEKKENKHLGELNGVLCNQTTGNIKGKYKRNAPDSAKTARTLEQFYRLKNNI